jgi:hypothetical protein
VGVCLYKILDTPIDLYTPEKNQNNKKGEKMSAKEIREIIFIAIFVIGFILVA